MPKKKRFKSASHKRAVLEHDAYLKSLMGKRSRKSRRVEMPTYDSSLKDHMNQYPSLNEKAHQEACAKRQIHQFKNEEYAIVIGYNKGNYTLVHKNDLKYAGKK